MDVGKLKTWLEGSALGLGIGNKSANLQVGVDPYVAAQILNKKSLDDSMPYVVKANSPYVQGELQNNLDGAGTNVSRLSAQVPLGPLDVKGSVSNIENSNFGYADTQQTLGLAAKLASGNLEGQVTKNSYGDVSKNVNYRAPFKGGNLTGSYYSNPYDQGLAINYNRKF